MICIEKVTSQQAWDEFVCKMGGHPLQLWGWGEVKVGHGWHAIRLKLTGKSGSAGAQILTKKLPVVGKCIAYIPRGPFINNLKTDEVLDALAKYARVSLGAISLSVEPHWEDVAIPKGWRHTKHTILIPSTLILDLKKSEDELMNDIARKRRYDIRKSTKDVYELREATTEEDIRKCLELYHYTAERAGFALHDDAYYFSIASKLGAASKLMAVWNEAGEPIAFTWLAVTPSVAFELYGGINDEGTHLRANFALKWYCITTMKANGVQQYDFNGLLNDGISTFKRNFATHENMLVGTYDKPLSPLYYVWNVLLPSAKHVYRMLHRSK